MKFIPKELTAQKLEQDFYDIPKETTAISAYSRIITKILLAILYRLEQAYMDK